MMILYGPALKQRPTDTANIAMLETYLLALDQWWKYILLKLRTVFQIFSEPRYHRMGPTPGPSANHNVTCTLSKRCKQEYKEQLP